MEISAQNLNLLFTGFNPLFQRGFEMAPSYFENITTVVPSSTEQEIYPWLKLTTGMREWVGDRVHQALEATAYTIVNKTFEDSVEISRERIADDRFGIYAPVIERLGWEAKQFPNQLIFGMMRAAVALASVTIGKITVPVPYTYDGLPLYSTYHPVGPLGQTSANYSTLAHWTASTAYAVGALVIDSNNNTQKCTASGTSGSTNPSWATTVLSTTTDSGVTWTLEALGATQSNLNSSGSGSYWFLVDAHQPIRPFIFQEREKFKTTRMTGLTDEMVYSQRIFRYGVDGRCNAGVGFWQLTYASNADLSNPGNYAYAVAALRSIKTDAGIPFGAWSGPPTTRFLVVPPSLEQLARQLLHSAFGAGTIAGAVSSIPIGTIYMNDAQLIVSEWLV